MDAQSEPVVMWSDHRIAMRNSPIHGTGSFAAEELPAGTVLTRLQGGIVFTSADWESGRVDLDGDMYNEEKLGPDLFRATPKANQYYFNHSCEANVVEDDDLRTQTTSRDVAAGDELTIDYLYVADRWPDEPCRCGTPACRNPPASGADEG